MDLKNKNIVLTGASSGIGYELSKQLAEEGSNLALISRSLNVIEELAEKLKKPGNIIIPVKCDVTSKEEVQKSISVVKDSFSKIDIAFLNAGTSYRGLINSDKEKGEEVFKVNIFGLMYFIEELLPDFKKRNEGTIIGVTSLSDVRGFPFSGHYSASKAAASHYLESLRVELKSYNIKVITIKPGFVKTPMTDKNEFYMPFLMDVEKAGRIIINGIKKDKTVIQFPLPIVLGSKLLKILPNRIYDFLLSQKLPQKK